MTTGNPITLAGIRGSGFDGNEGRVVRPGNPEAVRGSLIEPLLRRRRPRSPFIARRLNPLADPEPLAAPTRSGPKRVA